MHIIITVVGCFLVKLNITAVGCSLVKLRVFRSVAYYCSGLFTGEAEGLSLGCILLLWVAFW